MSQPAAAPVAVAQSLVGCHVGALFGVRLDGADLAALAARMAHLRALSCRFRLPPPNEPPLAVLPAGLRRLVVDFAAPVDGTQINAAIAAIGLLPLLEELTIRPSALDLTAQLSFAPLAGLPLLRRLDVSWPRSAAELSDAQVDELRALVQLRQLFVPTTLPLLRRLLRQPHDLQWQQIYLPSRFDNEAAALLPQLPSLAAIVHGWVECERFDWLRGLPNLAEVELSFDWPDGAVDRADSLVAGLQHCTNIQILTLDNCDDLTAAHLADLLPRLPRLQELGLYKLSIDSLFFLTQPPLTSQLGSLLLNYCRLLPPSELRHDHSLRDLRSLELCFSLTAPLGDDERALLAPPSAALPRLEEFKYAPRSEW